MHKYFIIPIILYTLFSMSGCAQINKFISDQPIISMVAAKHATARKISQAKDPKAKAGAVLVAVSKVEKAVKEQVVTLNTLEPIVKKALGYDKLSLLDKLLVDDLLLIAKHSMKEELDGMDIAIPDEYKFNIMVLLEAVKMGAQVHLE